MGRTWGASLAPLRTRNCLSQGLVVCADDEGVADAGDGAPDEARLGEHEAQEFGVRGGGRREAETFSGGAFPGEEVCGGTAGQEGAQIGLGEGHGEEVTLGEGDVVLAEPRSDLAAGGSAVPVVEDGGGHTQPPSPLPLREGGIVVSCGNWR